MYIGFWNATHSQRGKQGKEIRLLNNIQTEYVHRVNETKLKKEQSINIQPMSAYYNDLVYEAEQN